MHRTTVALTAALALASASAEAATLKAIQHGTARMIKKTGGSPTLDEVTDVALNTAVALDKSVLFFNFKGDSSTPSSGQVRGQFVNNQRLRFYRSENASLTDLEVAWTVVEFASGVFVQRNTGTDNADPAQSPPGAAVTNTSTVDLATPVVRDRSFALISGSIQPANTTFGENDFLRVELGPADSGGLSHTLVVRHSTSEVRYADWQVVEYTDSHVVHGSGAIASNARSASHDLPAALDLTRSFAMISWSTASAATTDANFLHAALASGTGGPRLLVDRQGEGTAASYAYQVVELLDGARVHPWTFTFPATEGTSDYLSQWLSLPLWSAPQNTLNLLSTAAGRWGGSTTYKDADDIGTGMFQTIFDSSAHLVISRLVSAGKGGESAKATTYSVAWPMTADLRMTRTATPARVDPSARVTTNVVVSNQGPEGARDIKLLLQLVEGGTFDTVSGTSSLQCTVDTARTSATCTLAALASGGSATAQVSATAAATPGRLRGHVELSAFARDPTPDGYTDDFEVLVAYPAELALSVASTPSGTAPAAGLVEYAATVANRGTAPASSLKLTATLPAGTRWEAPDAAALDGWACSFAAPALTCTRAALPAGATTTPKLPVRMPDVAGQVAVRFVLSSSLDASEPDKTNNETTVTLQVVSSCDLVTVLEAAPEVVGPGGAVTFTARVTNQGPSDAADARLDVALPNGSVPTFLPGDWTCPPTPGASFRCTLAALPRGASAAIAFWIWAPGALGGYDATATASLAALADPAPGNNASTARFFVGTPAFEDSTIQVEPAGEVGLGELLTYTITVRNGSSAEAAHVSIVNALPAGLQILPDSLSHPGDFFAPFALGSIAPGASATFRFQAVVTLDGPATIEEKATIVAENAPSKALQVSSPVVPSQLQLTLSAPDGKVLPPDGERRVQAEISGGRVRAGSGLLLSLGALQIVEESVLPLALEPAEGGALIKLPENDHGWVEFKVRGPAENTAALPLVGRVVRNGQPVSDEQVLTFDPQPVYQLGGCSCGASDGGAAAWLALASAAALWRRRRGAIRH